MVQNLKNKLKLLILIGGIIIFEAAQSDIIPTCPKSQSPTSLQNSLCQGLEISECMNNVSKTSVKVPTHKNGETTQ